MSVNVAFNEKSLDKPGLEPISLTIVNMSLDEIFLYLPPQWQKFSVTAPVVQYSICEAGMKTGNYHGGTI